MKFKPTQRGFLIAGFEDINGQNCSLQQSSLADQDAIWLGCNTGSHVEDTCYARMHLDREMAGEIGRILTHFAETGEIIE